MNYVMGIVNYIVYHNDTNDYTVGKIKIKDTDLDVTNTSITFAGNIANIRERGNYVFRGDVINHIKYGKQFRVESYEVVVPSKSDEIVDYLSSSLFPIGVKTAEKIVAKFKEQTLDIIINHPEKLLLVPRLSQKKIDALHKIASEYQGSNEIAIELEKIGFKTKDALLILKKYGKNSMDIINNNIYELITSLDFNFKEIDDIATTNLEIDYNDYRRVSKLIIYIINAITFTTGDTFLDKDIIYDKLNKFNVNVSINDYEYYLLKLEKEKNIVIKNNKNIYLKEFYEAEKYIASRIKLSLKWNIKEIPSFDAKIVALERINNIKYDKSQYLAIKKAITNNFVIITGGPGTGKTTIIKAIIYLLKEINKLSNDDIALLAPTGRASKRLAESTQIGASTIHRYLGWDKETDSFTIDEDNPNKEKIIIVDECSMIDTILMSALLKGTKKNSKYIFVGDYYQLPSVRQGQVLKDLIDAKVVPTISLSCIYRQNANSYITVLAKEVREKSLRKDFNLKKDDYAFINCSGDEIINSVFEIVHKAIEKGFTDKDIYVLAPIYKSYNGIDSLNKMLQEIFNPTSPEKNEIQIGDVIYREGDKIMQLVNEPDNNVYNGDIGYIKNIVKTSTSSEIIINFDGNEVLYNPSQYINFTHGYAISIHKSQGGEYKMVIIPFAYNYKRMLYNKLVYTAITRAKQKLILVGEDGAFTSGVNNDFENRQTSLKEFLTNN